MVKPYYSKNFMWTLCSPRENEPIPINHLGLLDAFDETFQFETEKPTSIEFWVSGNGQKFTYEGKPYEVLNSTEPKE